MKNVLQCLFWVPTPYTWYTYTLHTYTLHFLFIIYISTPTFR
jgi:hypothetical protein